MCDPTHTTDSSFTVLMKHLPDWRGPQTHQSSMGGGAQQISVDLRVPEGFRVPGPLPPPSPPSASHLRDPKRSRHEVRADPPGVVAPNPLLVLRLLQHIPHHTHTLVAAEAVYHPGCGGCGGAECDDIQKGQSTPRTPPRGKLFTRTDAAPSAAPPFGPSSRMLPTTHIVGTGGGGDSLSLRRFKMRQCVCRRRFEDVSAHRPRAVSSARSAAAGARRSRAATARPGRWSTPPPSA